MKCGNDSICSIEKLTAHVLDRNLFMIDLNSKRVKKNVDLIQMSCERSLILIDRIIALRSS